MHYALVQKELVPLDVECVKKAYRAWPSLTEWDAQQAVRDAFGIILKGLEAEPAALLQDAFAHEGIATEVVSQTALPVIPPPRVIKQMEFLPTHVTLVDPLQRHVELPWDEILLLAAGNVRLHEVRRIKNTLEEPATHGAGISQDLGQTTRTKDEQRFHLLLDLVLMGAAARYTISADDFAFDCLGSEMTSDISENYRRLLREIERQAPYVSLNRGAFQLCKESDEFFVYPGKMAFIDEMTWMLWRIACARAETAPPEGDRPIAP
jgi:hypothetical protein